MADNPQTPDLGQWAEDDLVMVSALEHYAYCPRQCALIHVEQTYDENVYTLRGQRVHERVHSPETDWIAEGRVERALPIWSERLGLIGKADLIVILPDGTPHPVEYKAGTKGKWKAAELQLCGQALCLEEMTGRPVLKGAVFYHGSRRRVDVEFDTSLRKATEEAVTAIRELFKSRHLPDPVADARCKHCSLLEACMPFELVRLRSAKPDALFDVSES